MENPRAPILTEARKLRDLGRFPEAELKFREAQDKDNDLVLRLELASMYMEQGRNRKCHEEVVDCRSTFSSENADNVALAALTMLECAADACVTVQFSANLRRAWKVYNEVLFSTPVEDFTKLHVAMLCVYLSILSLADLCGVDTAALPVPNLDVLRQLFRKALEQKRFSNVASLANSFASRAVPSRKCQLIDEALAHASLQLPRSWRGSQADRTEILVVRAGLTAALADLKEADEKKKEAKALLTMAGKLYDEAGHATGTSLLEVQRLAMEVPTDARQRRSHKEKILRTKKTLESFENLEGVRQTLKALYPIALADGDDDFRIFLDEETRRIGKLRGCPLDWAGQQHIMIQGWARSGTVNSERLLTFETLYEEMKDQEAPSIRSGLADGLATLYTQVGDEAKAEEWRLKAAQEPQTFPKHAQFLQGQDQFYKQLEDATAPLREQPEWELEALGSELRRTVKYTDPEAVAAGFLYFGVMKVMNMCDFYMNQVGFRTFDGIEMLVNECLDYSNRLIAVLPEHQKAQWRGEVLQKRARLLFVEACTTGPVPGKVDAPILRRSTIVYEQSLAELRGAGDATFKAAMVSQNLYICYKLLWEGEERAPASRYFGMAVESLEEAAEGIKTQHNLQSMRLNRTFMLGLWHDGAFSDVQYRRMRPAWRKMGLGVLRYLGNLVGLWSILPQRIAQYSPVFLVTPYEEAIKAAEEAEEIIDKQRIEFSALPAQQGILAKQHFRQDTHMRQVFQQAINLFGAAGDNKNLWNWIQRSKARSVSDLLGIGINVPRDLRNAIESDPAAVALLATEGQLNQQVQSSSGSDKFIARRKLEQHRREMRKNGPLSKLLDEREGKPVTWEKLQRLRERYPGSEPRRTWYVDWLTQYNTIFVMLVSDEQEVYHVFKAEMTKQEAEAWIAVNVNGRKEVLGEEDTSLESLLKLRSLVKPLLDLASEGDRFVFCPTDPLHAIPLHAAIVKGTTVDVPGDRPKEWKTFVEKYPVVYTSSFTIYEQNMAKRLDSLVDPEKSEVEEAQEQKYHSGAVVGVYEDADLEGQLGAGPSTMSEQATIPGTSDNEGWKEERSNIYTMCRKLAADMGWGPPLCGNSVHSTEFSAALANDEAFFFGHFEDRPENMLQRGIILGHNEGQDSRVFTVSDMFDTPVKAAHVTLVACGSAQQNITPGDEPLGFVTSLLYAGATSVTGTMWPSASTDGRAFTQLFFKEVRNARKKSDSGLVDMGSVLQVVVGKLRKREATSRPYSWAGFVLHGAWCL